MSAAITRRSFYCWRCTSQWIQPPRSRQLSHATRLGLPEAASAAPDSQDTPEPPSQAEPIFDGSTNVSPKAQKARKAAKKRAVQGLSPDAPNPLLQEPVPVEHSPQYRRKSAPPPVKRQRPRKDPMLLKAKKKPGFKESLEPEFQNLPSPPPSQAPLSAKLNALHARLHLSSEKFPIQTLARCLIDASADPNPTYNNTSLAILGDSYLRYHTVEYLISKYPRLPLEVIFSATWSYISPLALSIMAGEFGIEFAAAAGGEVDPGLLQFDSGAMIQIPIATNVDNKSTSLAGDIEGARLKKRTLSRRVTQGDVFGDISVRKLMGQWNNEELSEQQLDEIMEAGPTLSGKEGIAQKNLRLPPSPLQRALATFSRALFGAINVHLGPEATRAFFNDHVISRRLDISSLFFHRHPTQDLARLCAREGFISPVARILSETGRFSRNPVFSVGIFSGRDKLGEASGGSLNEARTRAAAAAMRGWYLYSPFETDVAETGGKGRVPSDAEMGSGKEDGRPFKPIFVDCGEVFY